MTSNSCHVPLVSLLGLTALAPLASSQSTIPYDDEYRYAAVRLFSGVVEPLCFQPDDPLDPFDEPDLCFANVEVIDEIQIPLGFPHLKFDPEGSPLLLSGEFGELDLTQNGTFEIEFHQWAACSNAFACGNGLDDFNQPDFESDELVFIEGTYSQTNDEVLELSNFAGGVTGGWREWLRSNLSREVLLHSEEGGEGSDPSLFIGIRKATGASAQVLQGEYSQVSMFLGHRFGFGQLLSGLTCEGTATFDGFGSYSATLPGKFIEGAFTGFPTLSWGGSYSVALDGELYLDYSIGGDDYQGYGQVAESGDYAFFITWDWPEIAISILVRKDPLYTGPAIPDDWATSELWTLPSFFGDPPFPGPPTPVIPGNTTVSSRHSTTEFDDSFDWSRSGEQWSVSGGAGWSHPGNDLTGFSLNGSGSLALDGRISLQELLTGFPPQLSPYPFEGQVSPNGNFLTLIDRTEPDRLLIGFAIREDTLGRRYGTSETGPGGTPVLGATGEFPTLGSTGFVLTMNGGLGGALAVLSLAGGPLPSGLPALGTTLYLNPATLILSEAVLLSGTPGQSGAGAFAFPLPIPDDPTLAGIFLYAQAGVIEAFVPTLEIVSTNGYVFRLLE